MSIDMDRKYTADEIEALDLPERTVLEDRDGDAWAKRFGRFKCGAARNTALYEPFRILRIPGQSEVESPPEVDWATDGMVWVRHWVAVLADYDNPANIRYRHLGSDRWFKDSRTKITDFYGIPADQLPPHRPAWPSPHGVSIEQAREIAAALAEHEAVQP
uniref:Uncharacterized protein n=1 Tax=uncultured bacterium A1Q1_fos_2101 TaxID=1256561 RepID=L7VYJ6_9BACT|nr:hypothetical protein [uncultured bacterium A1Q1_fos_2101]